ncbi:MAG TPA: hypothetical protein VGG06_28445 [Thermoanaerobaculia bacterium]|jgi:hypothetical protein
MKTTRTLTLAAALLLLPATAWAQTTVTLTDTSQTTTLTASVSEQAQVTVPAGVSFTVTDISGSTAASAASVTIDNIVLDTATKQLKVSIQANDPAFTPPVGGATTWSAGDVTWNAATWTNAAPASGTLSDLAYGEVATCTADTASCSTTGLVFTLGAKSTVKRSGNHTLVITWKFESTGA